jgi:hypothetical protein
MVPLGAGPLHFWWNWQPYARDFSQLDILLLGTRQGPRLINTPANPVDPDSVDYVADPPLSSSLVCRI